jgi:hypothetical protein
MGARESHAGDEFHVLWAVARALDMLSPRAHLRRLVIEGVSPKDQLGDAENWLHGVDLTEYLDGESFSEASEVAIAQLKYSERKPNRTWTVARLAEKPSRGQPVIRRLGEAFKAFSKTHGREEVLGKLRVRLISNQPVSPSLRKLLADARETLGRRPGPSDFATLLDGLDERQEEEVRRLQGAAGLAKREFTDFVRLLDLEYLGSGDRWQQETRIMRVLGEHLLDQAASGSAQLAQLVRQQMRPEAAGSPGIAREDVLVHLGVGGWSALFPMPPRFTPPVELIETADAQRLAQAVCDGAGAVLLAHGDAGVGKTTTIEALEDQLPEGSVVIPFDCFGGGEYLTATETRHLAPPVVMQLINEIALRCGTPLLLRPPEIEALLWQKLRSTLAQVGVEMREHGGHLVVAIDAIDNAVIAGRELSQPTFVRGFLELSPPEGVTLLATCRTHRRTQLGSLDGVVEVGLEGFDAAASARNLRRRFPEASDETCARFHAESMGNPRSQFYVLDAERENAVASPELAADEVRSTKHIFDDLVKAALVEVPDKTKAKRRLAELVCVSRPAKLRSLAGVGGIEVGEVRRFCHGLVPGVEIGDETVEFRDEDFETHLRDQVTEEEEEQAHGRLADYYESRREENVDAAVALAPHLRLAGRDERLMELALEEGQPEAIADPVAKMQVYFRRLELALQVAAGASRRDDAVKLIMLAARAARSDEAVSAVVNDRPDLAMRHGDPDAVATIYEEACREPWRGPMHLRIAALQARLGERGEAVAQMRMAEAWIRRWQGIERDERVDWTLEVEDVAAGATAVYYLEGVRLAFEWLRRWRPFGAVLEAARIALVELARVKGPRRAFAALGELRLSAEVRARLFAGLFAAGFAAPPRQVQEVVKALLRRPPPKRRRRAEWAIDFLELAARSDIDPDWLRRLLRIFALSDPELPPHRLGALGDWEAALRFHCLKAASEGRPAEPDDLIPPQFRDGAPEPEDHREQEHRREMRRRYGELCARYLPVFTTRARALVARRRASAVAREVSKQLEALLGTPEYRRREEAIEGYDHWAEPAVEALCLAEGDAVETLAAIAGQAGRFSAHAAFSVPIMTAKHAMQRPRYRTLAIRLLDQVGVESAAAAEPAGEPSARFLQIAGILDPHEPDLAADFYERAVNAAEGLDEQGVGVLRVQAEFGRLIGRSATRPDLAERIARAVEGYVFFVADPDHLPWRRTATAVASLCPEAGFALCTRWEAEDRVGLDISVPEVLRATERQEFIDGDVSLVLLRLVEGRSFRTEQAIETLEALRVKGAPARARLGRALEELSQIVQRDLLGEARFGAARRADEWLKQNSLEQLPGAPELIELAAFSRTLTNPAERGAVGVGLGDEDDREPDQLRELLAGASRDHPEDLHERLRSLRKIYGGSRELESYLSRFGAGVAPGKRREALDALMGIPEDIGLWRFSGETLLTALAEWLGNWRSSREVKEWVRRELPGAIVPLIRDLLRYEETAEKALPILLEGLGLPDGAGLVIEAIGPNLTQMQAAELYSAAMGLAPQLSVEQLTMLLEWSLAELEEEPPQAPTLPQGPAATIARLLWTLFGHPDKRRRWQAAHCARALMRDGEPAVGGELVALLSDQDGGPFLGTGQEFLWMSAQQWALLVIARAAAESPGAVAAGESALVGLALDDSWPHASVRELARRAALRLGELKTSRIEAEQLATLQTWNRARGALPESKQGPLINDRSDQGEEKRFRFDSMDTLPYWFGHLAHVFACDSAEIARTAEGWIVDRLRITAGDVEAAREQRQGRYDYDATGNRQGSVPRVESFRTYLEYHSMLLVAGQFIAEGRLVDRRYHGVWEDPWLDWLAHHLDASPDYWSIDLRGPVPLQVENFGELGPREQWRQVDADLFEAALWDSETIVVESRVEVSSDDRYGTTSVMSALVSPESARALQGALESCANPHNFRLPEEDGEVGGNAEIEEAGFELLGWLTTVRHEESGLEEHDPLRRIDLGFLKPGESFVKTLGLREEWEGHRIIDEGGEPVAIVGAWSDMPPSERHYGRDTYGSGRELTVDREQLLSFLREREMDLIIEVRIQRQFAERHRSEKEEAYDFGKTRIFILRRSGELEGLA